MSAAAFRASARFLWSRNRTNLLICAVGYGILLIGSEIVRVADSPLFQSIGLGYLLFTPLVFPLMMFIGSSAGADLMAPEGLFPRRFFVLPVAVHQIVLPFMVYTTLFTAAQWAAAELISDGRVLAFLNGRLWIPFLAVSFVGWMQALQWTPVRRHRARALQLLALLSAYVFVFVQALRVVFSAELTAALSVAQLPIAYAVAVNGVAKCRRGDPSPFVARIPYSDAAASRGPRSTPQLASPLAAQLWMERQIHRWTGKAFLVALLLPTVLLSAMFVAILSGAHAHRQGIQTLGMATIELLFGSLVIVGLATGINFGSFQASVPWNQPRAAYLMPPYFAALPLSNGDFAWAKMRAATTRTLSVSVGIVLLAALVAAVSGYAAAWMAHHAAWRAEYGLAATLGLAALPPLALVMLALSATASVMWIILLGRSKDASLILLAVCWLCALASAGHDAQILAFLSVFIPIAALAKVCALVALVFYVGSRGVLSWARLSLMAGFWAATAATLTGWLWWYAPASLLAQLSPVGIGILVAPILGAVAAPLALARNRAR